MDLRSPSPPVLNRRNTVAVRIPAPASVARPRMVSMDIIEERDRKRRRKFKVEMSVYNMHKYFSEAMIERYDRFHKN